jgi:GNAT superfamily N-acetyltransferase
VFAFERQAGQTVHVRWTRAGSMSWGAEVSALLGLYVSQDLIDRTPASLRRHGAGRALLNQILKTSREREYRTLFLETGRQPEFVPAHTLYRASVSNCGPFGGYTDNGNSVFMSLQL